MLNLTRNFFSFIFALSLILCLPLSHAATAEPIEDIISFESDADLPHIKDRKILRALVTYNRTDFTILPSGQPKGLQVELLSSFEDFLNRGIKREIDRTRIIYVPTTFDRLLDDLNAGKGDIAASLLTITPEREKHVDFVTGGVMKTNEIIVTHSSINNIKHLQDLSGREVFVLKNSSYKEHLQKLSNIYLSNGLKPINIIEAPSHILTPDILEMINAGIIGITVVDDFEAQLWSQVLQNIQLLDQIPVKSGTQIGWAIRKNNPLLAKELKAFSNTVKKGTLLGNILFRRYFGNTTWIQNPIAESEQSKFRQTIEIFSQYAEMYHFDVLATVAQAYQESQLDNSKKSHRGAMGIMQVLPTTAADPNVDIANIDILENNIHAGIKYLAFLRDRYFSNPEISPEDQLAFSWAAYNAGPRNVIKMRNKAIEQGLDPNIWFGNVEYTAAQLIGNETVRYVRNIFKYYIAYKLTLSNLNTHKPD